MSKARTLAGVVSTGAILADGTVNAAEIGSLTLPTGGDIVGTTSTQTIAGKTIAFADNTLTGVQATLTSGTNIKTINSGSLLGSGDVAVQPTLVSGTNVKTVNSTSLLGSGDVAVQPTLVSGTNVKTVNSTSLLGSGDVAVQPTLVSGTSIKTVNSTSLLGSGDVALQPTLVSGTNIKTINGGNVLGSGDLTVGGGSLIYLSTVVANNSSTVDIETIFNSTYDEYVIKVSNFMPSDTNYGIRVRVKVGGVYDDTSNYSSATSLMTSVGEQYSGNDGGTAMFVTVAALRANAPTSFQFFVHSPASTSYAKGFDWSGFLYRNGVTLGAHFAGAGLNSNISACTGIRFYMGTGDIVSGTFRLYGIKKS